MKINKKNMLLFLLLITLMLVFLKHHLMPVTTLSPTKPLLHTTPYSFIDTFTSYKYRKELEYQYRSDFQKLSSSEVLVLEDLYHRDVELQTMTRGLLPPAASLFSPLCTRYLSPPPPRATVSVVMSFYNEMPFILLRTLTIIVHRTPPSLLQEVVLVDDASTGPSLGEEEIARFGAVHGVKVVFFKSSAKMGITAARRKAIELSSGEVVAVLDSHMEVGTMWLEPLLDVIATRPHSVAAPCIRMISEDNYWAALQPQFPNTISMLYGQGTLVFDLTLPDDFLDYTNHYRSPSLAGGALLAARETLLRLYPVSSQALGWGVENSRLAVRAWLCAGGVFMSCCSDVTHPNGNDPQLTRFYHDGENLYLTLIKESTAEILNFIPDPREKEKWAKRVVEDPHTLMNQSRDVGRGFDYTRCKTFSEYMTNVHPHGAFDLSDCHAVGQLHSQKLTWLCVNQINDRNTTLRNSSFLVAIRCTKDNVLIWDDQIIGINKNGGIRTPQDSCWSIKEEGQFAIKDCRAKHGTAQLTDESQIFAFQNGQIKHVKSRKCLALEKQYDGKGKYPQLVFTKCNATSDLQKWGVKPARWL